MFINLVASNSTLLICYCLIIVKKNIAWPVMPKKSYFVSLHAVFLGASGHGGGDLLPALGGVHRVGLQSLFQKLASAPLWSRLQS